MKKLLSLLLLLPVWACAQTGIITTIAGNGTIGYSGDGGPATLAQFNTPYDVAVDHKGNIYVSENGYYSVVRKINTAGTITLFAGTGMPGYGGDGGPATAALLTNPHGIATDRKGNLYIADSLARIRKVDTNGIITTFAGTGAEGFGGDGGPATAAQIRRVWHIAADTLGNIYFGDNLNYRIRKIDTFGIITTVAGNGTSGYSGDGGTATLAQIANASGVAVDRSGNLFIADGTSRIRKVDASGIITTYAGTGTPGFSGDGGPATLASFSKAFTLTVDSAGNLYFPDYNNYRIRKINNYGIINTIAGAGLQGYSETYCTAITALLNLVTGLTTDNSGVVYIADAYNHRVRKVTADHAPYFIEGRENTISLCRDAAPFVLDTMLQITDSDDHQDVTWNVIEPPVYGTVAATYTMTTTGGILSPTGLSYTPAPGFIGADSFKVFVADCNNLTDTETIHVNINSCVLGVGNAANEPTCTLYPNPVTDVLNITATYAIAEVAITNVLGQTVISNRYHDERVQIDLAALPDGIYLLQVNGKMIGRFARQ